MDSNSSKFKRLLRKCGIAFSHKHSSQEKLVLWVIGCNRTGKTTVINILKNCPGSVIYGESSAVAYHDYRIKSLDEISHLIANTNKNIIVFELANDLQCAASFLNIFPHSKAFWIFRNYQDVARDAVKKWGDTQKDMMLGIGQAICKHPGQRAIAELMAPDTLSLVESFRNKEISAEDGAALLWYTRNQMYFQLGLDQDPRIWLTEYEALATKPREQGQKLFAFIGCAFKAYHVSGINALNIGKIPLSGLNPEIRAICEQLMHRLTEHYARQLCAQPAH